MSTPGDVRAKLARLLVLIAETEERLKDMPETPEKRDVRATVTTMRALADQFEARIRNRPKP